MTKFTKDSIEALGPSFTFIVDNLREIEDNTLVAEYMGDMESFPHNLPIRNRATFDFPVSFVMEKPQFKMLPFEVQVEMIEIILKYIRNAQHSSDYINDYNKEGLEKRLSDIRNGKAED